MTITVTQNFYFAGANLRDIYLSAPPIRHDPPNFGGKVVSNETASVNKVQLASREHPVLSESKTNIKRWILIAAWIVGMVIGLTLATIGACTANPLLTQLGNVVMTAFTGIGTKIVDHLLK
jgi:hypothetical protein